MSKNVFTGSHHFFSLVIICLFLSLPWGAQADIPDESPQCFYLTEIESEGRFHDYLGMGESQRCFELVIPSAGEVAVEVNSGLRGALMKVIEPAYMAGDPRRSEIKILEQGVSNLRFWAEGATSVYLSVVPNSPHRSLKSFTLITGFLPAQETASEGDLWSVTQDLDQEEREDPGEIEIEPRDWPGTKKSLGPVPSQVSRRCRVAAPDEYGDTRSCAKRLSDYPGTVKGKIANTTQGDEDVFKLEIAAPQRVELRVTSEADLRLQLEDAWGHPMHAGDGLNTSPQHLRTALAQGLYFVRIVGHQGAEGDYELHLRSPDGLE